MSRVKIVAVASAMLVVLLAVPAAAAGAAGIHMGPGVFGHHPPGRHHGPPPRPGQAVVSVESSPYGPVLVVGGAGAGYHPATGTTPAGYAYPSGSSLYFATVDPPAFGWPWSRGPYQAGCTTTVVTGTAEGTLSCTGSETDQSADWPAFTTSGPPVAGPGVNPWLLGSVYRSDLGSFQVTYAGHPLYLFSPGANTFAGANFIESVLPLPPWHTAWFLLSPDGQPAPGAAKLEVESPQPGTTYTVPELASEMLPNVVPGGAAISVYSFSGDSPWRSRCVGACAMDFVPVYTAAPPTPGTGVNPAAIGVIVRPDGTHQVTYDGHPLYVYSQEQPLVSTTGLVTTGTAGNGNGISAFGGTFSLVSP
jgi:predicted lipoprotein with Yx(FWY)xxD motif